MILKKPRFSASRTVISSIANFPIYPLSCLQPWTGIPINPEAESFWQIPINLQNESFIRQQRSVRGRLSELISGSFGDISLSLTGWLLKLGSRRVNWAKTVRCAYFECDSDRNIMQILRKWLHRESPGFRSTDGVEYSPLVCTGVL